MYTHIFILIDVTRFLPHPTKKIFNILSSCQEHNLPSSTSLPAINTVTH